MIASPTYPKLTAPIATTNSHVCMMRAKKNATELKGMLSANQKAARALSKYLAWVEQNYADHDEVTAADELQRLYAAEEGFQFLSFPSVSSVGQNCASLHYEPKRDACAKLIANTTYLCDSGANYTDGTTDTTRTLWLGDGAVESV